MTRNWTCHSCGVTASFQPGHPAVEHPTGWAEEDEGWRCLGCRRKTVVEGAVSGGERGGGAKGRRALTEFELLRDPEASDQLIAKRVRCSTGLIAPVRAALRQAGKLPLSTT
jgi:hypothetical protein